MSDKSESLKPLLETAIEYFESMEFDTCCNGYECGCMGLPSDPGYYILQEVKEAQQKLQAAEEELSSACELIKSLRELAIDLWENDASETDWLDVDRFHELIEKAEQALEKVKRGGE